MNNKIISASSAVFLAAALLVSSTSSAIAAPVAEPQTTATAESSIPTFNGSTTMTNDQSENLKKIRAKLDSLKGKQTAAEIKAIVTSPGPAELLLDPLTNQYVAAYSIDPTASTQAITISGPGCSTTSACLVENGTTYNGYNGSGVLRSNWNRVTRLQAGNLQSFFGYSYTKGYFVIPGKALNLTTPTNFVELSRS